MIVPLIPLLVILAAGFLLTRGMALYQSRALDQKSRPLNDPDVEKVAARLAEALDLPGVTVHVLEMEAVNGLVAQDGRIFLSSGFLREKSAGRVTPEELGSVIAHELGHVAHGHVKRRMDDVLGHHASRFVLAAVANRFLPGLGGWIANTLSRALTAKLSRRDEFEADAWATALMIRAGYGTAPQISLFHKLGTLTGGQGDAIPAWIRSHPKAEDRIAAIEANETRWRRASLS